MSNDFKVLPEVKLGDVPTRHRWKGLLGPLPYDKAIPFECETREEANKLGNTIQGSLRFNRSPYKTHRRILPSDGKYLLYVWKEKR